MALAQTSATNTNVDLSGIPDPKDQFEVGEIVEIFGLKGKPQWNGKQAIITGEFDDDKLRWPIGILDDEGNITREVGLLKSINLKLLRSCFNIVNLEGKGKGWIATRDIKLGSLIFTEKALFSIPMSLLKNADITKIHAIVEKIPIKKQKKFFALYNRKHPPHCQKNKDIFGNAIETKKNKDNDGKTIDPEDEKATTTTENNTNKNENENKNKDKNETASDNVKDKENTDNDKDKDKDKEKENEKETEKEEEKKKKQKKEKEEDEKEKEHVNKLIDTFDLLLTNAISMVSIEHFGIFPHLSRINHSCLPNARWIYIPNLKSEILIASRNIFKNEEICVSYMDFGTNQLFKHQHRVTSLIKRYNFICTCKEFCLNKEIISMTDKTIDKYNLMYDEVGKIIKESSQIRTQRVREGINLAEQCIDICINEWDCYSVRLFGALFECALLYRLIDEWQIAAKYLKQSMICFWYDRGIDGLYDKPIEINKELMKVVAMGGKNCKFLQKYILFENKNKNTNKSTSGKKGSKGSKGSKKSKAKKGKK